MAFDLFYANISGGEYFLDKLDGDDREVLTVLSVVDRSTGMVRGIPLPSKGHEGLVHAAKEVISFVSHSCRGTRYDRVC